MRIWKIRRKGVSGGKEDQEDQEDQENKEDSTFHLSSSTSDPGIDDTSQESHRAHDGVSRAEGCHHWGKVGVLPGERYGLVG